MSCQCQQRTENLNQNLLTLFNHDLRPVASSPARRGLMERNNMRTPGGYFATFTVCLLLGSPLGLMTGILVARLLSLTGGMHSMPNAAYLTWGTVAIAFQVAGFVQTQRYNRENLTELRAKQAACDVCGGVFIPWFERIRPVPVAGDSFLGEARMDSC